MSGTLHGREAELAEVRRTLERVAGRSREPAGGVIMLHGASGAGKSALAEAIIRAAEQIGFLSLIHI